MTSIPENGKLPPPSLNRSGIPAHRIEVISATGEATIGHHNVFTANQVGLMFVVGREFFDDKGNLMPHFEEEVRQRILDRVLDAVGAVVRA